MGDYKPLNHLMEYAAGGDREGDWPLSPEAPLSDQIVFLIKAVGMRVGEIAFACGVTRQTVRNWRKHTSSARDLRYQDLRVIVDRMCRAGSMEPRLVGAWLRSANRGLGGVRPLDGIRAGHLSEVVAAADAFTAGSTLPAAAPSGYEPPRALISRDDPDQEFGDLLSSGPAAQRGSA